MRHFDIAIIGAGPAGSTAAILLARCGYDVVLVDRARFPRDKVCGDYLTAGAVAILRDELGVEGRLVDAGAVRVDRQTVVAHDGRSFGGSVDALCCPRRITDAVLVDEARRCGVDVIERFRVREIQFDGDRVVGFIGTVNGESVEVSARVTVGADGTHSLLARRLGVVRKIGRLHRIALSAYIETPSLNPVLSMHLPVDRSDACLGVGPVATGLRNVTLVVPVSESTAIADGGEAYFRRRLSTSFPAVDTQGRILALRSTGCFGHRTTRAAFDGAVLVGDAATFIHPFTGEGVYYAMEGARLAAAAIDGALRFGHPLSTYDVDRARILEPRYRLCDAVQHVVHSPTLLSWFAPRLAKSPELTHSLLRTVGDVEGVDRLFGWTNLQQLLLAH